MKERKSRATLHKVTGISKDILGIPYLEIAGLARVKLNGVYSFIADNPEQVSAVHLEYRKGLLKNVVMPFFVIQGGKE